MQDFQPDHLLFRAIHPKLWDQDRGRPFRSAFSDVELSVYWSALASQNEALEHWLSGNESRKGSGIAQFTYKFAKDNDQEIRHDPSPRNGFPPPHPSHTLVIGSKSKRVQLEFAENVCMCIHVSFY